MRPGPATAHHLLRMLQCQLSQRLTAKLALPDRRDVPFDVADLPGLGDRRQREPGLAEPVDDCAPAESVGLKRCGQAQGMPVHVVTIHLHARRSRRRRIAIRIRIVQVPSQTGNRYCVSS